MVRPAALAVIAAQRPSRLGEAPNGAKSKEFRICTRFFVVAVSSTAPARATDCASRSSRLKTAPRSSSISIYKAKDVTIAKVKAKVVQTAKGKKISVIKFKRRKNYLRNKGHRQWFTEVEVTGITGAPRAKKAADTSGDEE